MFLHYYGGLWLSSHTNARAARQSGGLLILRSWVQIPSGPPLFLDSSIEKKKHSTSLETSPPSKIVETKQVTAATMESVSFKIQEKGVQGATFRSKHKGAGFNNNAKSSLIVADSYL